MRNVLDRQVNNLDDLFDVLGLSDNLSGGARADQLEKALVYIHSQLVEALDSIGTDSSDIAKQINKILECPLCLDEGLNLCSTTKCDNGSDLFGCCGRTVTCPVCIK